MAALDDLMTKWLSHWKYWQSLIWSHFTIQYSFHLSFLSAVFFKDNQRVWSQITIMALYLSSREKVKCGQTNSSSSQLSVGIRQRWFLKISCFETICWVEDIWGQAIICVHGTCSLPSGGVGSPVRRKPSQAAEYREQKPRWIAFKLVSCVSLWYRCNDWEKTGSAISYHRKTQNNWQNTRFEDVSLLGQNGHLDSETIFSLIQINGKGII